MYWFRYKIKIFTTDVNCIFIRYVQTQNMYQSDSNLFNYIIKLCIRIASVYEIGLAMLLRVQSEI